MRAKTIEALVYCLILAALLGFSIWIGSQRWAECRRVFSAFYCLQQGHP